MLTAPILVLVLVGQAPPAAAPVDENARRIEQIQPVDIPAADQNPTPAQKPPSKGDQKEPPTPEHTGIRALFENLLEDFKHIPSAQNLYITAGGGALALAVHPADQSVNASMVAHYAAWNTFFSAGKYIGNTPEQVAGSVATYAWGRILTSPRSRILGWT